ncbi:Genetic interactor of prohibitins 3 [Colletotrichum sidae]|uniref:Genetic interactor of prohibitins 3 n=1 Tax=Colletotrichum sidae TaxID=1347389 RepID=A0A4R8TMH0_9PEZI|nr:Genetic interactor of prohibitins 3 [Colletotrichum sidae]
MHRALSSRWVRSALSIGDRAALSEVPVYLCPSLAAASTRHSFAPTTHRGLAFRQRRCLHVETAGVAEPPAPPPAAEVTEDLELKAEVVKKLPEVCSGCGALSQVTEPGQAGYYDYKRRSVRDYVEDLEAEEEVEEFNKEEMEEDEAVAEDRVVDAVVQNLGEERLLALGLDPRTLKHGEELETSRPASGPKPDRTPLCDRCHKLVHNNEGVPIYHPTVDTLRETIEESPFKKNHIYHVIDAADFPMSFMPKLHMVLEANLKHRNRRNKSGRYYKDRRFDMDFIITRSDLLAPKKEMVDKMMPYLREVLRGAMGKYGKLITLGNVRCVSAQRGWWTALLKETIYDRGGAGWMVGKVNVGKSALYEVIFPKGTTASFTPQQDVEMSMFAREEDSETARSIASGAKEDRQDLDGLLPPARAESNYPEMPTVSALPGTTASPIRIPYGNGRGELIDLPGVARSDLELYVKPEHRKHLVMKHRIVPEQYSIRPGQSLLLGGGLIRITPTTPDLDFILAYNFTPIPEHLTATEKAIEYQEQKKEAPREAPNLKQIATPEAAEQMKLAGTFKLRYDVTKERSGPQTRKDVANRKVETLPWRNLGIDVLIEGVGWVEIVAQVRTRRLYDTSLINKPEPEPELEAQPEPEREPEVELDPFDQMAKAAEVHSKPKEKPKEKPEVPKEPELNWPVVEVYAPEGRFIGSRKPLNAWLINRPPKKDLKKRPRKSMVGAKKADKQARRAAQAS